ncbi:MAG: bifunctional [glutamine synthetase] adenylyltransferase/[glutamine synthetase]-adenylyl-L-tyrosine phosphorylase [Rhodospirillales bacterium]
MFQEIDPAILPVVSDPQRAARGWERFTDALGKTDNSQTVEVLEVLRQSPGVERLLDVVFDHSPYLTAALCRQPEFGLELLRTDPAKIVASELDALRKTLIPAESVTAIMKRLRQSRDRVAIAVALADIAALWTLEAVTGAISDLADATVNSAVACLLRQAHDKGDIRLPDPEDPCKGSGFTALGMGKQGGRELNYSSDIDLILLFDPERVDYQGKDAPQTLFSKISRNLIKLLSERTGDGQVFRVDLRLRPDPGSTPPAVSVQAAETYYEAMGQNWERAAMIKARAVAGDIEIGEEFLRFIQPFIWRKHLDFASIEDIHSIKRQIDRHYGGSEISVAGHDVKLGRGGIREIEFFVQTQQLIWGGRQPELRGRATLAMLRELVRQGHVTEIAADELEQAYRFLRSTEHRLQMVDDAQTHAVPEDDDKLKTFAKFAGFASTAEFAAELVHHLMTVERHYSGLFEASPQLGSEGSLVFTGVEDDPETLSTLARMGFSNTPSLSETIRGWHHGRYRATRSNRTRQYLTELTPRLLKAFAAAANPDTALLNFDRFLAKLPAGVQLFAMFHTHPELLDVVAEIMGGAPRLAEQLSRRPDRLEAILDDDYRGPPPSLAELVAECDADVRRGNFFEDKLDIARRWAGDRRFLIGLQILRGQMKPADSGPALSHIAEAVLRAMLTAVQQELEIQHGRISGGRVMLLAMGKLASKELMPGSDLDVILIYDTPEDSTASDGAKPLAVSAYYSRLCQRLVNALTALTAEGMLYEIDLRLRPSGNKGPLACSLIAFDSYHRKDAWTWEHMALSRARPVAGDDDLCDTVTGIIAKILRLPRDRHGLLRDVYAMRMKMAGELDKGSLWDVKQARGGIVDGEFIIQYLLLREAAAADVLGKVTMAASIAALHQAGSLDKKAADTLTEALEFWQSLQAVLRVAVVGEFKPLEASAGMTRMILRAMDAPSLDILEQHMLETATAVHDLFTDIIAEPAQQLPAETETSK